MGPRLCSASHLYNKEKCKELNINFNNNSLEFQASPIYLGIKLDRSLPFGQHLETLSAKTIAHAALIRRLACKTWGSSTKTPRVFTQAISLLRNWVLHNSVVLKLSHQKAGYDHQQWPTHDLCGINLQSLLASLRQPSGVKSLSWHCLLHQIVTETQKQTRLKLRWLCSEYAQQFLRSTPVDTFRNEWLNQA